jgi:CHAD domain-containing protein
MLELELKLVLEGDAARGSFAPSLPCERAGVAGIQELPPLDLRATYYDTPDLRLARSGITLRHRTGERDDAPWTLKLPEGRAKSAPDSTSRDELEFAGPASVIPDEAEHLVAAFVRSGALTPVARLRTRRRRWSLRDRDGAEIAELVDDRVSVLQRGRVVERFRELEIEGRGLDRAGLERIASALAEGGAAASPQVPKLVRALGPRATAPPEVAAPGAISVSDPAAAAVRAAIARSVERIVSNDPRTRLGEVEPLHQMRVGARRLRSDLRTFGPLVEREWANGLREELRWLGGVLGEVRDLDVLLQRLHGEARDLGGSLEPLFEVLEGRRARSRAALRTALDSARYLELLDRLVEAAGNPALKPAAGRPAKEALPPLARRSWKRLRKEARKLGPGSADEDFHRARVLAKRARYAAEAIAPALGAKRGRAADRFAGRAADIQDVLGELQDSAVAGNTVLGVARERPGDGAFNLAAGRLVERELQRGKLARERFPSAWRRLSRPKRRGWM